MSRGLYSSTKITSDQIRLVQLLPSAHDEQIRCGLEVVERNAKISYKALSYYWGSEAHKEDIVIQDSVFAITPTLASALRYFRQKEENRVLWIDQICIDQSSNDEKSHQVSLMGSIYNHASQVLMWQSFHQASRQLRVSLVSRRVRD
ncbi:HET-domain-containing protein [Halenospora varia]|nr:HET-domain-containing protein [Halenospora varia]